MARWIWASCAVNAATGPGTDYTEETWLPPVAVDVVVAVAIAVASVDVAVVVGETWRRRRAWRSQNGS